MEYIIFRNLSTRHCSSNSASRKSRFADPQFIQSDSREIHLSIPIPRKIELLIDLSMVANCSKNTTYFRLQKTYWKHLGRRFVHCLRGIRQFLFTYLHSSQQMKIVLHLNGNPNLLNSFLCPILDLAVSFRQNSSIMLKLKVAAAISPLLTLGLFYRTSNEKSKTTGTS